MFWGGQKGESYQLYSTSFIFQFFYYYKNVYYITCRIKLCFSSFLNWSFLWKKFKCWELVMCFIIKNVYLYPYLVKRVNDGLLPLPVLWLIFCIVYIPFTHIEFFKTYIPLPSWYIYVFDIFYIAFASSNNKRWYKELVWWMLNC